MFDDQFLMALAAYMAHAMCPALTGDKAQAKILFELADKITRGAQSSNGNEGLTVMDSIPDWMRVRGYASDWAYPPGSMFFTQPQALTMIA